MKTTLFAFLLILASSRASASSPSIEYRLKAVKDGTSFKWSRQILRKDAPAKTEILEKTPFLSNRDIRSAEVRSLKSPPSDPNRYEVELLHTIEGIKKFDAVANNDRDREFCLIVGEEIYQCSSFPPEQKGLWDKSTKIYGPFLKENAEKLVSVINKAVK